MPRKTKESEENEIKPVKKVAKKSAASTKKVAKKTTSKKTTTKKATSAKKTEEKKPEVKKATAKKTTTKKAATKKATAKATTAKKTTAKKTTSKATATTTKKATAKTTAKKETTKKAATKKTTTKATKKTATKTTTKKTTTTRKRSTTSKKAVEASFKSEYYDLPYMYNKTVVKVLAQTPKMLFIYWEISDEDRLNLENTYGTKFFERTRPVLIVYNDTMHYSFEVDINDFANSWYLHIDDANCDYHVELGRRPYPYSNSDNGSESVYIPYYIYLTSSNEMAAPNNRMLFNPYAKTVRFRNVKTGEVVEKDINEFKFITNLGLFSIRDLYKFLFPGESFEYENIVLGHTSSGALSSSGMFSSQFK